MIDPTESSKTTARYVVGSEQRKVVEDRATRAVGCNIEEHTRHEIMAKLSRAHRQSTLHWGVRGDRGRLR